MKAKVLSAIRAMSDSQLIETLFLMAERHPDTLEQVLLAGDGRVFNTPFGMLTFTREQMVELRDLVQSDQKVASIKLVRAAHGLSLKDAKDFVEQDYGLNMNALCGNVANF